MLAKRCDNGLHINILTTGRHRQKTNFMNTKHTNIQHQYDVWDMAKTLPKSWQKAAKKSCSYLFRWIQSMTITTCNHDASLLGEEWTYIIHQTSNSRSVTGNHKCQQCLHPVLSATKRQRKRWLKLGSKAHQALKKVVLDKKLINN